jgi:2-polyprenyl-6-methoxyphenol hydroxylase-like FAD-dependent oxidoreductase
MSAGFDIAVIGAGSVGLCFARALAESGLQIVVLERQPEPALAIPVFDGREIALTHNSAALMRELGLWERIDPEGRSCFQWIIPIFVKY